jgi:outer membrane protein
MAFIRVIITLLLIAAFSAEGCAQDWGKDTTVVWDLETCISYAKQHNIRLNSLKLDQRTSEQELRLSKAGRMPDLYTSATWFVNHNDKSANGSGYNGVGTFGSGDYGLSSSWTLYHGGYVTSDIRQKDLYVEAAKLDVLQQENDITLRVIQYYLNVLLDKESIIYKQSVVSTSAAQVVRARNQLAVGSIAQKELLQLEAQLANDKYSVITSENAKKQHLVNLKQLLQLPLATELDIVMPDSLLTLSSVEKLRDVQEQALNDRPEVKNGIVGIAIARAGLDKALSGYKPALTLSGFMGSSYAGSSPGYFRQLSNSFNQQLGLTLSVPIFTCSRNAVNVAEARISVGQAMLRLKDTRTALSLTIEKAYINLVTAQTQFQAATEAFKYNQETYRVADEQLKAGLINMVEYLQQKTLYLQAQQQFLQAKYNAALTCKIYDFYKGNSSISN